MTMLISKPGLASVFEAMIQARCPCGVAERTMHEWPLPPDNTLRWASGAI